MNEKHRGMEELEPVCYSPVLTNQVVKQVLFWVTEQQGGFFFHLDKDTVIARREQLKYIEGIKPLYYEIIELEPNTKSCQIPAMYFLWAEKHYALDLDYLG